MLTVSPRRAPISYRSRTQFFLINGPLAWSIVAGGVAQLYLQRPPLPIMAAMSLIFVFSVRWMFIGRALTNSAYDSGTPRFLGIDISKNLEPSRAERLGIKFNYAVSAALGLASAVAWTPTNLKGWGLALGGTLMFAGGFQLTLVCLTSIEMVLSGFRFRPVKDRRTTILAPRERVRER